MSTSKAGTDGKLSFAFGASGTSKPAAPAAGAGGGSGAPGKPMSNMEALLAKAKAKNNGTPNNGKSTAPPKKVPPKSIFGDDDEDDAGPSSAGLASARAGGSRTGRPDILSAPSLPNPSTADSSRTTAANLSRGATRAISSALALDPAAFAYDEVYDNLKAGEAAREAQRKAEAAERAPKYIDSFLASAETRRLDKLRAEEKMLAREREKEGGEFDDKEKFVTEGYKKQMEEVRKAEAEEKKREEAMRKSGKGPGLTAFYKTILETKTTGHDAVVASAQAHGNAGPSLAIRPPTEAQPVYEPADEYDPTLDRQSSSGGPARGAIPAGDDAPSTSTASVRAGLRPGTGSTSTAGRGGSGRLGPTLGPMLHDDTPEEANGAGDSDDDDDTKVQINDDGEVVNKRTLLRAGLNITKKPLSGSSHLPLGASGGAARGQAYVSRAVGTAASYKDRMERERQRLADNMRLEAERRRQEEEERYREEEEAARRRREGDDGQAEARRKEAKERYLERKRKAAEGKNGEKDKGKEEEAKRAKI